MEWENAAVAAAIGIVATLAAAGVRMISRSTKSEVDRLSAKGSIKAQGLSPEPGAPQVIMMAQNELEDLLKKHARSNGVAAWAQNFIWFAVGSGVSLYSNEIRSLFP